MPYKNPNSEIAIKGRKRRSKKSYEKLKDDEEFRKRRKFNQMKFYGIKGDYENIWRLYEATDICQSCQKIMVNGRGKTGKCVDHHHSSGYFRHVICGSCNAYRAKHDRLMLSLLLEIHRYHFLKK
tara:strand:+ start:435 stop:809 length:375 start_codon:yes stop_codon:yes gene_type:complete